LQEYKNRNLKEVIAELTVELAEGKELLGYNVDETSKKINSMILILFKSKK